MKRIILTGIMVFISMEMAAQTLVNVDYISNFKDGIAAVKKNGKWGFINENGAMVVPYRDDLYVDEFKLAPYPGLIENRAIIVKVKDAISYFGYIDESGNTVIEPQFLNASDFHGNHAIAIKLEKEELGKNDLLDKNVIRYSSSEVVIDKLGQVIEYLTEPKNIALDANYIRYPPKIGSKFISEKLIKVPIKDQWNVVVLNDL